MNNNKRSDVKTVSVSSKKSEAPKKQSERRKQAAEKTSHEVATTLEKMPALTFALQANGGRWIGPNLISPIELAQCAFQGLDYNGPYPEHDFQRARTEASERRNEIITTVEKQVRRLRKSGVAFVLLWQAYGEGDHHLDYSADFADADVRKEIADLLVEEANWMIYF